MHDPWTDRLSEYADGDLAAGEKTALEAHLGECLACRDVLAGLREVAQAAATLENREPETDLWPGILGRIAEGGAEQADPSAVDVHPIRRATRLRRFSFSAPQLLAASVAMMAVSGGAVWLTVRTNAEAPSVVAVETAGADESTRLGSAAAVLISSVEQEYSQAIDGLEREFNDRRDQLEPETIRVVEDNLRVIDEAIAEARAALARDPANGYLYRHLDRTLTKKVDLLRRAAGATMIST